MNVLQVSAEIYPLLKTGGLADVTGALPAALTAAGCEVRALLPGFPAVTAGVPASTLIAELQAPWGEAVALRFGTAPALQLGVYWIDAPGLYDRPGNPYHDERQQPYADNQRRFALLGWCAALLGQGLDRRWHPRVVHSHDWHAGLAPAYLAYPQNPAARPAASVHTVHNLAYQGVFAADGFAELGLPPQAYSIQGLEYHGQLSFMKAGLYYADRITTVSPTYAREIQTAQHGCGLDGLLASRSNSLSGILNGVDDAIWNPAHDSLIAHRYDVAHMVGKAAAKAALQQAFGLDQKHDALLFGVVSRLTEQKGMQLMLDHIDELVGRGGQLMVLGSGDAELEAALRLHAAAQPRAVAARFGYDEALAHRIFAASDVTLVPSRFEPCGLTQMYGLKYGALPLVHRVGGLADTVVDCALEELADQRATGFVFDRFEPADYAAALRRAFALYAWRSEWARVRERGMTQRFDWARAASAYLDVYSQAIAVAAAAAA
ncbi:MAG: glycogen synthase GlgA [Burkholderiaceae bacterium]